MNLKTNVKITTTGFILASALFLATTTLIIRYAYADDKITITSKIVSFENTHATHYDGSVFHTYFYGESIGTKDAIAGLAVIEPGHEIHPPHAHAEEEYLYIVAGNGTWMLNGEKMPAKAGDLLYASPWDVHGIFNTGKTTMKFFITKANSKGIDIPVEPKSTK